MIYCKNAITFKESMKKKTVIYFKYGIFGVTLY